MSIVPLALLSAHSAIPLFLWGAVALCACAAILWALLGTGLAWRLATDIPNDRSLHTRPTPRVGGWGIVPVAVLLIGLAEPALWLPALAAALLAALSQIDDRRGLPARVRFGGHAAAVALLVAVYPADVPWWALACMAVLLVWLVNLYNFMDGSDGLAGGMALFGFAGYAIAASISSRPDPALALACAIVAGAAAGFLLFNFHPARIFLGDAGSIPLGFLAGALGYWGWRESIWPVWFPAVCFSAFIGDASVTLLKRLLRGEKFWQAHREHYYQRLVQSGFGHAPTTWVWYLVMVAGIMLALWAMEVAVLYQWLVVVAWAVVLVVAGLCIDRRWRHHLSRSRQS
ncbi:MAG: Undecaprenyl-phosphate alpha-N-acetylglucosaminyl 1-phosphate transferase (EC [uncultured Paraburkholderia sp.]|nr:MAG: Undecaprenyl-phosphate alpha-N-acetylglucosaminyl 1-phosphate transferase (EC [uncultured Paraburkholderia sp.]CAH2926796.1 MAG: Undecaprenyl-phosphate alpha-N-acetylglucosaminyl 1-phosphate transferase (EC [uncultured Paraburkholderia sp.]